MATTKRSEENHLDYVRRRLIATPTSGLTRFAADAGLSVRTLLNIRDTDCGAHYATVMKLYEVLRLADTGKKIKK